MTSELNAEQRRLMDGVKFLVHTRLDLFVWFVLDRDKLVQRVHRPYCDFLAEPLLRKFKREHTPGPPDWEG